MIFDRNEVPVAYSMVRCAERQTEPLSRFACFWMAFNNIYVVVADRNGLRPKYDRRNGELATERRAHVAVPKVKPPKERDQIQSVFAALTDDVKHSLIIHSSTAFFVRRTPCWRNTRIEHDATGQRLNGVLNVGFTIDKRYPVWSPVDPNEFERYASGDVQLRNSLSNQILWMLYTIRNNLFHGGKLADDANDLEVVEKALPLLMMIVNSFLVR